MKTLLIEDYHKHESLNQVEVWVSLKGKAQRINVNLFSFESWLEKSDKLEWVGDYSEEGNHRQIVGRMSLDEFWELPLTEVSKDLMTYIKTHPLYEGEKLLATDAIKFLTQRLKAA